MISYDIVSLQTGILIDTCLDFIIGLLENNHTLPIRCPLSINLIMKSLKFCFNSTFFTSKGILHTQVNGVAIGSPIRPVAANLFMAHIEFHIFTNAIRPRVLAQVYR